MAPPVSPYAWILWSFHWKVPAKRDYTLVVRPTDKLGAPQREEPRNSYPDGALGLHAVSVTVNI